MFNDKYGLTQAVLEGRKTMTRRILKAPRTMDGKDVYGFSVAMYRTGEVAEVMALDEEEAMIGNILPKYKPGEVVAVAQRYKDAHTLVPDWIESKKAPSGFVHWDEHPGYSNKEFVKAEWMPHQIRITNVRIECLQDISDEDCLREGVMAESIFDDNDYCTVPGIQRWFYSPCDAFAALIDKVSGKGTWDSNPWVFVYEFELVK